MDQVTQPTSDDPLPRADDSYEPNVVHQASGMIAGRDGITCAEALNNLRRYAAATDQPLPAVCEAIVTRSLSLELGRASHA